MGINKSVLKYLPKGKYLEMLPDFKEKRTQQLTTIILTILGFIIMGLFAISPTLSTIMQLKKQLEDNQLVEKKLDEKIANLNSLQRKYNNLKSDLPLIFSALPQSPNVTILLGQIQAIAQASNIDLVRLGISEINLAKVSTSPSLEENPTNYTSFTFSLNAEGTYLNISKFIFSLSNFDRLITIETTSLTKNEDKKELVKLTLAGKVFFKK